MRFHEKTRFEMNLRVQISRDTLACPLACATIPQPRLGATHSHAEPARDLGPEFNIVAVHLASKMSSSFWIHQALSVALAIRVKFIIPRLYF
jgi:hypothetical protein